MSSNFFDFAPILIKQKLFTVKKGLKFTLVTLFLVHQASKGSILLFLKELQSLYLHLQTNKIEKLYQKIIKKDRIT